jgi:hypothetical protein
VVVSTCTGIVLTLEMCTTLATRSGMLKLSLGEMESSGVLEITERGVNGGPKGVLLVGEFTIDPQVESVVEDLTVHPEKTDSAAEGWLAYRSIERDFTYLPNDLRNQRRHRSQTMSEHRLQVSESWLELLTLGLKVLNRLYSSISV